jgi:hypothetical protein
MKSGWAEYTKLRTAHSHVTEDTKLRAQTRHRICVIGTDLTIIISYFHQLANNSWLATTYYDCYCYYHCLYIIVVVMLLLLLLLSLLLLLL